MFKAAGVLGILARRAFSRLRPAGSALGGGWRGPGRIQAGVPSALVADGPPRLRAARGCAGMRARVPRVVVGPSAPPLLLLLLPGLLLARGERV